MGVSEVQSHPWMRSKFKASLGYTRFFQQCIYDSYIIVFRINFFVIPCVYVCECTCVCVFVMNVCVCSCMHMCMSFCVHVYACVCVSVFVSVLSLAFPIVINHESTLITEL